MKKVWTIAVKDTLRSLRSPFSLVMMFVAPLLIAGLLYLAFGSLAGGSHATLSQVRVHVANLDQPQAMGASGFAAGEQLVEFLQEEDLNLLSTTEVADEATARAAVDGQRADVAVIIPADFSTAVFSANQETFVTLYQDPTLTIGPSILEDVLRQLLDGFSGAKIAADVASRQFQRRNAEIGPSFAQGVAQAYAAWMETSGHHEESGSPSLHTRSPSEETRERAQGAAMIGPIMASMMIFFVFFIGANAAESIVREDEQGTLARLFTIPTSQTSILGGKFAAVLGTLLIQIVVLLLASSLLFDISWGRPVPVVLLTAGLITSAAGLGVLLMSFVNTTRQAGPVMGGVLTITGMLGGLFTSGIPNVPATFERITLVTPHGWALRGWKAAMAGGGISDVLVPAVITLGTGVLFFAVGAVLFRRRFN